MNPKLNHLQSLADSAHAALKQCADDLRDTRDRFHALDRRREKMQKRGFDLSAPDATKHAELDQRIAFLTDKHATLRADHKAKRALADRCQREAAHA